ncbi:hypothetical protein Pcinc_024837 [Petrolisthes cinctipes]|uniref:Uncharacterized protein n=1 Tax=Petrolisthes cinctipes TaxID=88211 RepID=A0AAE1F937_PETCI|nr:hypothetical protein Pcinc_024837 [Petrolisthes cinctipes]
MGHRAQRGGESHEASDGLIHLNVTPWDMGGSASKCSGEEYPLARPPHEKNNWEKAGTLTIVTRWAEKRKQRHNTI